MRLTLERFEDNPQLEGENKSTIPCRSTMRPASSHSRNAPRCHGVPAWKLLPADMGKSERSNMADIAAISSHQPDRHGRSAPESGPGPAQSGDCGCPGTVYALTSVTSPKEQPGNVSLYTTANRQGLAERPTVTTFRGRRHWTLPL